MRDPLASIEVEAGAGRSLVSVFGEIDLSNADDVGHAIERAIDSSRVIVIDLREVEFMDSQGVRMLHDLAVRLGDTGVALEIVAPSDTVAGQVLRLTQLDSEVPVREDLD